MKVLKGDKEYFKGIGQIRYEGRESDNPLAFKFYDATKKVGKKTMEEHFRFAIAYWHTFCGVGGDPFGPGTKIFPWLQSPDAVQRGYDKMDAAFEFITKIGAPFYCFHDYDLIDEGPTLKNRKHAWKRLLTMPKRSRKLPV
jgi:xylose isomerase